MTTSSSFPEYAARLRQFMARSMADGAASQEQAEGEFGRLASDLFALQFQWNAPYRKLCEARGRSPANVSSWADIPAAPTSAFKELELTSLAPAERTKVFHSSGTTGQQPSRHFHGGDSLALYEASLIPWFQKHLLPEQDGAGESRLKDTGTKLDFLILAPPMGVAPRSSLVHMLEVVVREFGSSSSIFCGEAGTDGAWSLDQARAVSSLRKASESGCPLAVMGTAFNYVHLLDALAGRQERIELPAGSWALETGGYKGRSRDLPKSELHALITDRLGIPPDRIVCEYGMSELCSQAYDLSPAPPRLAPCASRRFRFPPWARAQVISPETGREVSEGETGLLRVFDLANVWSVLAVQTEDLAVRHAEGFELLGRARLAEPRGCSLMAV